MRSGYLVLRDTSAVVSTPTNGTGYLAGNAIGSATVAYVGATAGFTNTGLTNDTTYHYKIFAYDATTYYSTGTAVSAKPQVCAGTNSSPTMPTYTQITSGRTKAHMNWGEGGSGTTGYVVLRQASYTVCDLPVDGTTYSAGNSIGTSSVVYTGNLNGFNDSSLTNTTTYYYRVFAYTSANVYSMGQSMNVTPKNWTLAGTSTNLASNTNGNKNGQYPLVENGILYMSLDANGFGTYQLQTTPSVSLIAGATHTFSASTYMDFVDKKGSYAYASVYGDGLHVIDASNPLTSLPSVGNLALSKAEGVVADGNFVYVTGRDVAGSTANGGLHVIDVSNKAAPTELGAHGTNGCVGMQVQKFSHYVYVSCRNIGSATWEGILIYDVSTPATPTLVKSISKYSAEGLRLAGKYLLVSARGTSTTPGLEIYDLSNPADPVLTGSVTWTGTDDAADVTMLGDYAIVTNYALKKITAIDISNPASPSVSTTYAFSVSPVYINHDGQNVIISLYAKGFRWEKIFQ